MSSLPNRHPVCDDFTANPVVLSAVESVRLFGGTTISREDAAVLMPFWKKYSYMSPQEREAALRRFPESED
jgi:hypothetical protein